MTSHMTQTCYHNNKEHTDTFFHTEECSPKQALPRWEVGSFEESVLEDAFHSAQSLDHVCPVVVEIPQLAIVTLVRPPEWVLLQHLSNGKSRSTTNVP